MRKIIIALALSAALASCNQGGGETAIRQKIVDSMTNEYNQGHIGGRKPMQLTDGMQMIQALPAANKIASFVVPMDTAVTFVNNWFNVLKKFNMLADTNCRAFIIPSSNIQYLTDSLGLNYMVFYLSVNSSNMISLLYQGGWGSQTLDTLTLYPVKYGTVSGVFDNTMPCPVCPVNGLIPVSGIRVQ